ncbi:MAG: hypothetical protein D3911_03115 [Candidatus Electrothrix sp. AW3_4]|nr:hypothetical protein [Candidatus Electrothrix gigas]
MRKVAAAFVKTVQTGIDVIIIAKSRIAIIDAKILRIQADVWKFTIVLATLAMAIAAIIDAKILRIQADALIFAIVLEILVVIAIGIVIAVLIVLEIATAYAKTPQIQAYALMVVKDRNAIVCVKTVAILRDVEKTA